MKKLVVKIYLHDDREKSEAMRAVVNVAGVDSISMDMKEPKMTVIGEVDPVDVVGKLRKRWRAEMVSVGSPKAPEKKQEAEKPEKKVITDIVKAYEFYHKPESTHYYPPPKIHTEYQEYPNDGCVIS